MFVRMAHQGRVAHLVASAACAWVLGCSDGAGSAPAGAKATPTGAKPTASSAKARPENVLVLTLDTTRADRLGCYGYKTGATPNLDRLAAQGVRFDHAYAHVPLTLPSHASLFTGRLPPEHGLHDNGRGALPQGFPTLAEIFREHGFRTGAFVSAAVLDSIFGLDRGFDVYDDRLGKLTEDGSGGGRRRGDKTASSAIAWLDAEPAKPFFAWIHFFDPHAEYQPPPPFNEQFKDPYDGEIAYMDREIGRLFAWLDQHRLTERTLIVAVADHGESLGEHGENTHGILLYEATMRVPLLLAWPGGVPRGRVIDANVQTIDLAPTILDLCGFEPLPYTTGQSLVAALSGAPLQARSLYGESEYCYLNFGWAPLRSITTPEWRYIQAPKHELYDRRRDPAEKDDCAERSADAADALGAELDRVRSSMRTVSATELEANAELTSKLEGLGYVQSRSPVGSDADARDAKNPREHMPVLNLYHEGHAFAQAGRFADAIPKLEAAARAFPDGVAFRRELGRAYFQAGDYPKAQAELEAALKIDPLDQPAHYFLGSTYGVQGRNADALRELEVALELQPNDYAARQAVAYTLLQLDRVDDAIREMQKLVEQKPAKRAYRIHLAQALRESGRHAETVAVLTAGVDLAPQDPELSSCLAWELATNPDDRVRDGARAVLLAERVCALDTSKNATHLDTLAAAYAEAGRFDAAITAIDEALRLADPEARGELDARKRLYTAKRPYRDE